MMIECDRCNCKSAYHRNYSGESLCVKCFSKSLQDKVAKTISKYSMLKYGDNVAVEWQFATINIESGERQVVSDGIIGKVKDGKIILWKEYLDGRVKNLQASGELELEEGEEPFPWPRRIDSK